MKLVNESLQNQEGGQRITAESGKRSKNHCRVRKEVYESLKNQERGQQIRSITAESECRSIRVKKKTDLSNKVRKQADMG